MSAELERLFTFEAQRLEPLFIAYKQAPSVERGRAYNAAAGPWLRDATVALQAASDSDPWKLRVGQRFDVVVRSTNTIRDAGHGLDATSGEIFSQVISDTATGFANNVKDATSVSLDLGGGILTKVALAAGALAVLYIAVRIFR